MGLRGPQPTPTRILQLRGTYRKDRHGDPADQPQLEELEALPPPPGFFDTVAAFEWDRIGHELVAKRVLCKADLAAFTGYCCSVSRAVNADRAVMKLGSTMVTPQGFEMARPEVAIAKQAWSEVNKFAREFGITPSSRSRVRVPQPTGANTPKGNPFEDVG